MSSKAARGNALRALGREMSSRARSARVKLGELSGAELAIGGLGAIVAGGLLLSNLSGASGVSRVSGVGGVGGDLDTAKMRQMDTTDLLDYFSRASFIRGPFALSTGSRGVSTMPPLEKKSGCSEKENRK